MKKFNFSIVAILAMSTFAVAGGDIKDVEPAVEPVMEVAVADAWAGPYVGLQAGYIWGDADTTSWTSPDVPPHVGFSLNGFDVDGWTGGIFAGHIWRVDNDILLGIEGEWNYASADDTIINDDDPDYPWGAKIKQEWDASLRLIAGKDMGDYMPYITGGIAWAGVNIDGFTDWGEPERSSNHDATLTGWTVGAGVEKKIDENLHARIQYRYSDYGDETWWIDPEYNDVDRGKIEYKAHMLTVGLSYRF